MAAVSIDQGRTWGYIDKSGAMVIRPQYQHAGRFSNGLARIGYDTATEIDRNTISYAADNFLGYIDKTGEIVLRSPAIGVTFEEGLTLARSGPTVPPPSITVTTELVVPTNGKLNEKPKMGLIDRHGRFVIGPLDLYIENFSEGRARVHRRSENEPFGFIDRSGKIVIDMKYKEARSFSGGYAAVKIGDQWGFVDKAGKLAVEAKFMAVGRFSDGLASACVKGKDQSQPFVCGYIDYTGNWAFEPSTYIFATDFRHGLAFVVSYAPGFPGGYVDKKGTFVWRGKMDESGSASWPFCPLNGCSLLDGNPEENYPCELKMGFF
jgi:hypothetical protein